jgi:hypothetical protein
MPLAVVAVIILGPQLMLYMKSGMYERYLIPSTLATSLAVMYLSDRIVKLESNVTGMLLISVLSLVILKSSAATYKDFKQFAAEGKQFNRLLSLVKGHSQAFDPILFVSDQEGNAELSHFVLSYFESPLNNRTNIHLYLLPEPASSNNDDRSNIGAALKKQFEEKSFENSPTLDYKVIALPAAKEALLGLKHDLTLSSYAREAIDSRWVIFYKK